MKTPKRSWWLVAVGASMLLSAAAQADKRVATDLPTARLVAIPETLPESIAATTTVAGIFPALPPPEQRSRDGHYAVSLFLDRDRAEAHRRGDFSRFTPPAQDEPRRVPGPPCFVVAEGWSIQHRGRVWPVSAVQEPRISGVAKGSPAAARGGRPSGIAAVRLEVLSLDGPRGGELRFTHALFDTTTLGMQQVAEGSMRLALLAEGPGEVRVLAARDPEEPLVHLVITKPEYQGRGVTYLGRYARAQLGTESAHGDCGHLRLSLPTDPGIGSQGTVVIEVVEGDLPKLPGADVPHDQRPIVEVSVRELRVSVSASQSSSDAAPIVSAGFSWAGKAKRRQIY
ncbi:MAG: hypothetical protein R3B72_15430 [Polyangiaceae bacterium]